MPSSGGSGTSSGASQGLAIQSVLTELRAFWQIVDSRCVEALFCDCDGNSSSGNATAVGADGLTYQIQLRLSTLVGAFFEGESWCETNPFCELCPDMSSGGGTSTVVSFCGMDLPFQMGITLSGCFDPHKTYVLTYIPIDGGVWEGDYGLGKKITFQRCPPVVTIPCIGGGVAIIPVTITSTSPLAGNGTFTAVDSDSCIVEFCLPDGPGGPTGTVTIGPAPVVPIVNGLQLIVRYTTLWAWNLQVGNSACTIDEECCDAWGPVVTYCCNNRTYPPIFWANLSEILGCDVLAAFGEMVIPLYNVASTMNWTGAVAFQFGAGTRFGTFPAFNICCHLNISIGCSAGPPTIWTTQILICATCIPVDNGGLPVPPACLAIGIPYNPFDPDETLLGCLTSCTDGLLTLISNPMYEWVSSPQVSCDAPFFYAAAVSMTGGAGGFGGTQSSGSGEGFCCPDNTITFNLTITE